MVLSSSISFGLFLVHPDLFLYPIQILSVAGHQMPGNCRNISDEVWTGIHVGDKSVLVLLDNIPN